jgi:hypothetical protein
MRAHVKANLAEKLLVLELSPPLTGFARLVARTRVQQFIDGCAAALNRPSSVVQASHRFVSRFVVVLDWAPEELSGVAMQVVTMAREQGNETTCELVGAPPPAGGAA